MSQCSMLNPTIRPSSVAPCDNGRGRRRVEPPNSCLAGPERPGLPRVPSTPEVSPMRPVETDLRPRAEAAARAALERRWKPVRFELELGRETPPGWSHVFQCAHYSASFRV